MIDLLNVNSHIVEQMQIKYSMLIRKYNIPLPHACFSIENSNYLNSPHSNKVNRPILYSDINEYRNNFEHARSQTMKLIPA